jgi:hypothetical protein
MECRGGKLAAAVLAYDPETLSNNLRTEWREALINRKSVRRFCANDEFWTLPGSFG